MAIIAWIVFGFIVGLVARALLPGRQHLGFIATTLLGIAGSLLGGLVASALRGGPVEGSHAAGFLGSLLGAIVVLLLFGGLRRRTVV